LLLSTQIITADIKRLGQKMKNPTSKIHNENQSSPKSQCGKKLFVWMVAGLGKKQQLVAEFRRSFEVDLCSQSLNRLALRFLLFHLRVAYNVYL